ncbi:protein prenylyltransferase [Wallemia mellicola]|uniref:Geranylgeranyl transferase type-2 subunit alpha n=1 Tax=Wallemia mellicola TaxID=1708541 RepID=A0AB74KDV6_9BASI|nr:protein prenylyltransferase [Wallemia mellicola]
MVGLNDKEHGIKRQNVAKDPDDKISKSIKDYRSAESKVLDLRKNNVKTPESLDSTTHLLDLNPEYYSIWNYRRIVLLHLFTQIGTERTQEKLSYELVFTLGLLKRFPKVYWIWNHRTWALETLSNTFTDEQSDGRLWEWNTELKMVDSLLKLDARNFHAWGYRRQLLTLMNYDKDVHTVKTFPHVLSRDQLLKEKQFTLTFIESNFSNFSAWHQRTKILKQLWALDGRISNEDLDEEFDLVRQAMYTDPSDQSVWLYHKWLIQQLSDDNIIEVLNRELESINELYELEPESKWCLESLAHYNKLLYSHTQSTDLVHKYNEYLDKLISIDPDRRNRYMDSKITL